MAKLKINSGVTLEAKLPELPDSPKKFSDVEKLQQSISSVSNGITQMKQRMNAHEVKITKLVSNVKKDLKSDSKVDHKKMDENSRKIDDLHEQIMKQHNELKIEIEKVKKPKLSRVEKVKEIIQPKVEQIVHHKDHEDDIVMLNQRITNLNIAIKENEKIAKKAASLNTKINICLSISLIVSILLKLI